MQIISRTIVQLDRNPHAHSIFPQRSCKPGTPCIQLKAVLLKRPTWYPRLVHRKDRSAWARAAGAGPRLHLQRTHVAFGGSELGSICDRRFLTLETASRLPSRAADVCGSGSNGAGRRTSRLRNQN